MEASFSAWFKVESLCAAVTSALREDAASLDADVPLAVLAGEPVTSLAVDPLIEFVALPAVTSLGVLVALAPLAEEPAVTSVAIRFCNAVTSDEDMPAPCALLSTFWNSVASLSLGLAFSSFCTSCWNWLKPVAERLVWASETTWLKTGSVPVELP